MAALEYKFTSDILFKILFTENEALLRSLVAAALGVAKDDIKTLRITNPEILPEEVSGKFCRLDLNMVVNDDLVDLEIQVADEGNFRERAVYYLSRIFAASVGEGEDYVNMPHTMLVSIIDFDLFDCVDMHSEFAFLETTRHELLTDRLGLHFYELRKLPESINTKDMMQVWMKLFSAKTEEDLAEIEKLEVAEMAQAVAAYKKITRMSRFQQLEQARSKARHDEAQALTNARRQNSIAIAKKALQENLPVDMIARLTGLPREDIEALQ
ncbi:MAG: Rpn family recombination-promoting nuclease/putative transposase [Clostridiales Family XIII bacterium]|jgi:predicted transposase/invertase (TIGR01784 family)|nr:Rpn family recombination-promoting nuclease/putative transposase [Clostridiales Family XIII bacterium]